MTSMRHSAEPDHTTIEDVPPVVLGVDTHKDMHVAAVLNAVGVLVGSSSFPAAANGYRLLLA